MFFYYLLWFYHAFNTAFQFSWYIFFNYYHIVQKLTFSNNNIIEIPQHFSRNHQYLLPSTLTTSFSNLHESYLLYLYFTIWITTTFLPLKCAAAINRKELKLLLKFILNNLWVFCRRSISAGVHSHNSHRLTFKTRWFFLPRESARPLVVALPVECGDHLDACRLR